MIHHTYKFIYIHIPKTGGTSVESSFNIQDNELYGFEDQSGNYITNSTGLKILTEQPGTQLTCLQHLTASQIMKRYSSEIWSNYFKFTFVRNPWDLQVSNYSYILSSRPDLQSSSNLNIKSTFREYLKNVRMPGQLQYITHPSTGQLMINYIGRFENIQQDYVYICNKLNITGCELPHLNKTKHEHYTEYYDDETREIVAERYARDIEHFGYEFGK